MTLRCLLNLWRFKELRLRGISTPEVANAFAEEFMADYNRRFAKPPRHDFDVHRPFENDKNLGATYTWQEQRKGNDSNLLIVFYVQIMPDDFVMQLHRF